MQNNELCFADMTNVLMFLLCLGHNTSATRKRLHPAILNSFKLHKISNSGLLCFRRVEEKHVKLLVCTIKYQVMQTYRGVEVWFHIFSLPVPVTVCLLASHPGRLAQNIS
jgi:hypothetical protein